jgi:hypothetical protein
MSKSSFCYLCGKPIKFDNEYINERTGKKIPLDAETNEPHNCPVRSQQEQQQSQPSQLQQQQHTTSMCRYIACEYCATQCTLVLLNSSCSFKLLEFSLC